MDPAEAILNPAQNIGGAIVAFIPSLISALILFLVGWVIGALVGQVITSILRRINIGSFFERLGLGKEAGKFDWPGFLGWLVEWFIIFIFLVSVFDALGLPQISQFIRDIAAYIPNIIAAVLIIIFGAIIADGVSRLIGEASKTSRAIPSGLLAAAGKWAVLIFAVFAALVQLRIAPTIIEIFFAGIVAVLVIALGLAFGLGGQEWAKRVIEEISSGKMEKK